MSETHTDTSNNNGMVFWVGVSASILVMLLLGWYFASKKDMPAPVKMAVDCAPIPDGMQWKNGKLSPVAANASLPGACAPAAVGDWLAPVAAGLASEGYGWMRLEDGGEIVRVMGMADTQADRDQAFALASHAIQTADNGAHANANIVNEITLRPWAGDVAGKLQGLNFNWLNFAVRGPVATLSGTAPNEAARDEAFAAAQSEIAAHPVASGQITRLVNGIVVEGDETGAADALVELTNAEGEKLSVEDCATAFTKTMQGRNIQFQSGSAEISTTSAQLLDALSGIATLCVNSNGHSVEIGGHTDATGDAGANQLLSQARADSVRNYLVNLGVDGTGLDAIGYGQTRLLDPAGTAAANAINRRTEFSVK